MKNLLRMLFVFGVLLLGSACNRDTFDSYDNYVILVSCDAFRWDYPDMYDTPNLDSFAVTGVKAERLQPSFPSLTFPNHYTIATGLYPDHHGLIHNKFFAPDLGLMYRIGDRAMVENPAFYGGEPIWVTAEKQGMITASYFWVGSEAPIEGIQPHYWKKYEEDTNFTARVDTVIKWLSLPLDKRPRFVTLYFQEPDETGHDFGPVSEQTDLMVSRIDSVLGYLKHKVDELPYGNRINIIYTADHGMGPISPDKYVNISKYLDEKRVEHITGSNPVYLVDVSDGYADSAVTILSALEGVKAYRKEDMPEHLHYGTNPRIPDIIVYADSSWSIGTKDNAETYTGGAHGYDPDDLDMNAIFYAVGPDFKIGYHQPSFRNVDIYGLVCELLGLDPAPNDGDMKRVEGMLRE